MSQPRVGDNIYITSDISNKFPWITDFAETKFIYTTLLEAINDRYRRKIESLTIQTTLQQIKIGLDLVKRKKKTKRKLKNFFVSQQILTILAYPVKMYQDCTGVLSCFENKKYFVLESKESLEIDRERAGPNKYMVGFLDWSGNRAGTSRYDYLSATGQLPEQVSKIIQRIQKEKFGFTYTEFRKR